MDVDQCLQKSPGLVRALIKRYFKSFCGRYYEEMYSAGMEACWKASLRYDPAVSRWSTFAGHMVYWRILDLLRSLTGNRAQSRALRLPFSLEQFLEEAGAKYPDGHPATLEDQHATSPDAGLREQERRQALRRVLGREAVLLETLLDGGRLKDACGELGVGESRVSQMRKDLFARIRAEPYLQDLLRA